jgi:hypothetical protein
LKRECVGDVSDAYAVAIDENANDVEPVGLRRPSVSVDPDEGGTRQLLLFLPVDRFHGITELASPARFDLDERNETLAFDHQVDVPMSVSKPPLNDPPAVAPKPPLRNSLSELSECLLGR